MFISELFPTFAPNIIDYGGTIQTVGPLDGHTDGHCRHSSDLRNRLALESATFQPVSFLVTVL
jgi:hypothetical protein